MTVANFPTQTIYTFSAAARILGYHPATIWRLAKDGKLRTIDTPLGRRIHRDEIRRQLGEPPDEPVPTRGEAPDNSRW